MPWVHGGWHPSGMQFYVYLYTGGGGPLPPANVWQAFGLNGPSTPVDGR